MRKRATDYSFEEIREFIKGFAPCMDDYLYFYDISQDLYYISEKALERFALPSNEFSDVAETHRKFVHEEDVEELVADLNKMVSGEKDSHDIEYRWIGKNGEPIWINCQGRVLKDRAGKPAYMLGCVNEIGRKQKADNVSGLKELNSVADTITTFCRVTNSGYTLHMGIDDFKAINERFGHEYGDGILRSVADCIQACLSAGEEVYRVVADEFLVVSYLADSPDAGRELYIKIRKEIDKFIEQNRYETVFTISGGVLDCSELGGVEYEEFLKLSQFALNQAKILGRNQVYFFSFDDYNRFLKNRTVLSSIKEAVSSEFEGFEVYYQPIVRSADPTRPYGAEALLRYTLPNGDRVSPMEFIPVLEDSGLIIPVGKWVLKQAMSFCQLAQKYIPDFRVNVNVSYVQVIKSAFVYEFVDMLQEQGMAADSITIELTESGQLDDSAAVQRVWANLKKYGVSLALDDFGTGYSNLMNISDMTPNVVKLDRGFTLKALKNEFEHELMANIINMVHSLGLLICVEGVETQDELYEICKLNPDFIQGYFYGRPTPADEFIETFCK